MFKIKAHDDYHEILPPKGWKAVELGCYPDKRYGGPFRYFAVYYNGIKPTIADVVKSLVKKVQLGKFCFDMFMEEITEGSIRYEVTRRLKTGGNIIRYSKWR